MRKATYNFEKSFSHVYVPIPTLLLNCTNWMVNPQNKNYICNLDTLGFPMSALLLKTDLVWYFN